MSTIRRKSVGDRIEWIRHLLYAPDKGGVSEPIAGRTRMMKACFLLSQKLEERFDKRTDFEFIAHKYGPFDKGVYDALEQLESAGEIEVISEEEAPGDEGEMYKLTSRGLKKAKESYAFLSERERELVEWVKYTQASRPLGTLLSYVYSKYPSYTTNSELV